MKTLQCFCGESILLDDDNYLQLNKFNFSCGYRNKAVVIPGSNTNIARYIIHVPEGYRPDHKNRNVHDNRKENLRIATTAQNSYNRGLFDNNSSGYKGVSRKGKNKKWRAAIVYNGVGYHLGTFDTPEKAALAYNNEAKRLFGEFAFLNNIKQEENV